MNLRQDGVANEYFPASFERQINGALRYTAENGVRTVDIRIEENFHGDLGP